MARAPRSDEGRAAGLYALGKLQEILGDAWPAVAWEKSDHAGLPPEIMLSGPHAIAFAQLLELALRLDVLPGDGGAKVKGSLRSDPRPEHLTHLRLQLELAALAVAAGLDPSVETHLAGADTPADVVVSHGGERVAIETFGILISDPDRFADRASQRAFHDISMTHVRYDVGITGSFDPLSSEGLSLMLEEIDATAAAVCADGVTRAVDGDGYALTIDKSGELKLEATSGARDLWPRISQRLSQKAAASARSGSKWLRVDVVSGLWQFTDWAFQPFSEKVAVLGDAVRSALTDATHLHGVMVSSGACFIPGDQSDEDVRGDGVIGLRRVIQPLRARESILVALHPAAEISLLVDLYAGEPAWLGWALTRAGLGPPDAVLAYRES
jgi:hypothetical protein